MLAICWDHWCPSKWPRIFPFEVFLFFFLVLTGYLITGSLLRERDRGDAKGLPWKLAAMKTYQIRRGLRILAPYYAALALAWLVWAPDVHAAPAWYVFHLSNIHMAFLPTWPFGTNHFWSLSIQQQFYLIWPLVIWFVPRKMLVFAVILFTTAGPVSRMFHDNLATWAARPELLSWFTLDYFGCGALLALAHRRGMSLESPALKGLSLLALTGYLYFLGTQAFGWPTFGVRALQQTCLSIALCGFIASASAGFSGKAGAILELPFLQRVGKISYGIYLFHNLAPLVAGKLFWFLWNPSLEPTVAAIAKIVVFAAVTWGLAAASWRWIENPLQSVRAKMVSS